MLEIYLTCLVIGSILIGFTLFGGEHSIGEGHGTDIHFLHDDANFAGHESSHIGLSDIAQWFSVRNIIFFAAFFGLTGAVLTWLGFTHVLTLLSSLTLGFFSAGLMHHSMKYLKKSESGVELHTHSLKGYRARVVIDISREQRGKISVDVNGRILQLPAKVSEIAVRDGFRYGENVLIIDMENGTAHVIENEAM